MCNRNILADLKGTMTELGKSDVSKKSVLTETRGGNLVAMVEGLRVL